MTPPGAEASSNAYLQSVIGALKTLPGLPEESQAVLENCICTLAGMANMLSTGTQPHRLAEILETLPGLSRDEARPGDEPILLAAPADSLAVTASTARIIETAARWTESKDWTNDVVAARQVAALVRAEHELSEQGLDHLLTLQRARPNEGADGGAPGSQISAEQIAAFFESEAAGVLQGKLLASKQVFGGRSRQTVLISLESREGKRDELVIQRDNPAHGKPQSVVSEFPLLRCLFQHGLKVPEPLLVESDPQHLGAPFLVVKRIEGEVAESDYFKAPQSPELAEQLAVELARLHSVEPDPGLGLRSSLGGEGAADWREELAGIEKTWNGYKNWPSIGVSAALGWMKGHVAHIEDGRSLVHGDATFHNVLRTGQTMTALLDWELAHIGHPAEDLGYCRGAVSQIMPWPAFIEIYEKAGGRRIPPETLDYFSLRAVIHIIGLIQKIRQFVQQGLTRDVGVADLGASFIPKLTHRLSKTMVEILEG